MGDITITADGAILRGHTYLRVRISGTSPRILTTRLDASYAGLPVTLAEDVDVTHVWGSPVLAQTVNALLEGVALPASVTSRRRRNGTLAVRWERT